MHFKGPGARLSATPCRSLFRAVHASREAPPYLHAIRRQESLPPGQETQRDGPEQAKTFTWILSLTELNASPGEPCGGLSGGGGPPELAFTPVPPTPTPTTTTASPVRESGVPIPHQAKGAVRQTTAAKPEREPRGPQGEPPGGGGGGGGRGQGSFRPAPRPSGRAHRATPSRSASSAPRRRRTCCREAQPWHRERSAAPGAAEWVSPGIMVPPPGPVGPHASGARGLGPGLLLLTPPGPPPARPPPAASGRVHPCTESPRGAGQRLSQLRAASGTREREREKRSPVRPPTRRRTARTRPTLARPAPRHGV